MKKELEAAKAKAAKRKEQVADLAGQLDAADRSWQARLDDARATGDGMRAVIKQQLHQIEQLQADLAAAQQQASAAAVAGGAETEAAVAAQAGLAERLARCEAAEGELAEVRSLTRLADWVVTPLAPVGVAVFVPLPPLPRQVLAGSTVTTAAVKAATAADHDHVILL